MVITSRDGKMHAVARHYDNSPILERTGRFRTRCGRTVKSTAAPVKDACRQCFTEVGQRPRRRA